MAQLISSITVLVPDYDEAIQFFIQGLGFDLLENTRISDTKHWVRVAPKGAKETSLLLAKATSSEQKAQIGNQGGGRVFLFVQTYSFEKDYALMKAAGVHFLESPRQESYGPVAVFQDPWGNKYDLIGNPLVAT